MLIRAAAALPVRQRGECGGRICSITRDPAREVGISASGYRHLVGEQGKRIRRVAGWSRSVAIPHRRRARTVAVDQSVVSQVRNDTDREITKQLERAEAKKPTEPSLSATYGRDGDHKWPPTDLLTMATWAEAVGHSEKAISLLTQSEDHLVMHIAWLGSRPRRIGQRDRDEMIAAAQFLLTRTRRHLTDDLARAADALDLSVRSRSFDEKSRMSAALAPAFKEAVRTQDADLMRTLAIAIADAQGDPAILARVSALPMEQFVRYGRIVAADEELLVDGKRGYFDERRDEALIENLLAATEDGLMERRLDDFSGHEREVLEARHTGRLPYSLTGSVSYSTTGTATLGDEVRMLRRSFEVAIEAGGYAKTKTSLKVSPTALIEMAETLRKNQAAVSLRVIEEYRHGNTTEATLCYALEAQAIVDGHQVSMSFVADIAKSRQPNPTDRLERAVAEGRAKQLPTPDQGLWGNGKEITGASIGVPVSPPVLSSLSDMIGQEAGCAHQDAEWSDRRSGAHRVQFECPSCFRRLAHVPRYRLPDKQISTIAHGTREEVAKRDLAYERSLAQLRGDALPTLDDLLAEPRINEKGYRVVASNSLNVGSVAAAMNRR